MSKPDDHEAKAYMGWGQIAKAVTKALKQSVVTRTARRYAEPGRENRLPVYRYPNGRVYLMPQDLALWAAVWMRQLPVGAQTPGKGR